MNVGLLANSSLASGGWPCLDLAHLHARTEGSLHSRDDFHCVLNKVESRLGKQALRKMHIHMYPIHWGAKGEIQHRAFDDATASDAEQRPADGARHFLPRYEPLLEELRERDLDPVIICEARNSQDVGALAMKNYWHALTSSTVKQRRISHD